MHCIVWRDKNFCSTNLCDRRLTRIIRINKTRAEKCCFTVLRKGKAHVSAEDLCHLMVDEMLA